MPSQQDLAKQLQSLQQRVTDLRQALTEVGGRCLQGLSPEAGGNAGAEAAALKAIQSLVESVLAKDGAP